MKHLVLLSLAGMLATRVSAQTLPHWGDNRVLVQTADPAAAALRRLAQACLAQGYLVAQLDTQACVLRLLPHPVAPVPGPELIIRATATTEARSLLELQAEYAAPNPAPKKPARTPGAAQCYPVVYVGSPAGPNKTAFYALQQVAQRYPNATVSYGRR